MPSLPPLSTLLLAAALLAATTCAPAAAQTPTYGPELEGFTYPYPVKLFSLTSPSHDLHMAYMDVAPAKAPRGVVVLLHGKNFCGATWEATIAVLSDAGYRVIVPDQIGFCKSSKPGDYRFSFEALAGNTHSLLAALGIDKATLIGHSTGGMLAIRYALIYPDAVRRLILVDPIGLEDWRAKGVPAISVDEWRKRELNTTADSLRRYEQATYYAGQWKPAYDRWVAMLAGMYAGAGRDAVAQDSALLDEMILTQPVVYDLHKLAAPTVLIVGDKDTTAIGRDLAPPEARARLGNYPELAKAAAAAIPNARLIEYPTLGHAPQIQDPDAFRKTLLQILAP